MRAPSKGTKIGKAARFGPTVSEHKRERQKKTLRVIPAESGALAQLAARWRVTESEAAARAILEALAWGGPLTARQEHSFLGR